MMTFKSTFRLIWAMMFCLNVAARADEIAADLPVRERVNLLNHSARERLRLSPPDRDGALALYARIVDDPESGNSARIEALHSQAGIHLDAFDLPTAEETMRRALTLPDLSPAEQRAAWKRMGDFKARQADYPAAREAYRAMLETDDGDRNRDAVDKLITAAWIAEGRHDEAIAINRRTGREMELADIYWDQGDIAAARDLMRSLLTDTETADRIRQNAFVQLLQMSFLPKRGHAPVMRVDYETARKDTETFLPDLMAADANRAAALLPLLKDAMEKGNYPYAAWAAAIVLQAPDLPDRDLLLAHVYRVDALSAQGEHDAAIRAAETAAAAGNLSAVDRFRFQLTVAALRATDDIGAFNNAVTLAVKGLEPNLISNQDQAGALLNAGKSAMMAGHYAAARALYDRREAMFVKLPPASLACEFVPSAPADVGSWLASSRIGDAARKGRLDRPYGANLALLLETDATTAERGVTADAQHSADTETEVDVVCDVAGIHFFFLAKDSAVDAVLSGLQRGGSYEGYLSTGPYDPYYTCLINLPSGFLSDSFHSMYPNRYFRQARKEDDTVRSFTQPTDRGFATYLFYPWVLFYNRLPENGDVWQFEMIRWTRAGGFSLAGSASVHNRSSWGEIVFSGLTAQYRRAIKRQLVFKAFAQYKNERNPNELGAIDFWQDPDLGDPAFYETVLAPIVARLDGFGKAVAADMADADVDRVFEQAVPLWMEFKYKVAELRREYLEALWFEPAGQQTGTP